MVIKAYIYVLWIFIILIEPAFSYDTLKDRVSRKIHHEERKQKNIDIYKILLCKWKLTPKDLDRLDGRYYCIFEIILKPSDAYVHSGIFSRSMNTMLSKKHVPKDYVICFYDMYGKIIYTKKLSFKRYSKNRSLFYCKSSFYTDWYDAHLFEYAKIKKQVMKEYYKDL